MLWLPSTRNLSQLLNSWALIFLAVLLFRVLGALFRIASENAGH